MSGKNRDDVALPKGYCLTTIGEVVEERVLQDGPSKDSFIYLDIGSVDRESKKFFDLKTVSLNEAPSRAKQVVQPADVLVSMTRPNLNAVAMVTDFPGETIASTGFHVLRSPWIEPKFLLYLVQTEDFIQTMSSVVQGALYPAVRPKDISSFQFELPPRGEQCRIVEKLEELLSDLDAGVAELKVAQRKLAQYRQSLLKAAVDGVLTADWRAARSTSSRRKPGSIRSRDEQPQKRDPGLRRDDDRKETGAELLQRILAERRARWAQKQLAKFAEQGKTPPIDWQLKYSEPLAPDLTDLPPLPASWVWGTLDQATAETLIGLDRGQEYQSEIGNVGYIKMNNVSMTGDVDTNDIVKIDANTQEIQRYAISAGDLLFNTRNSKELVGKVGIVRSVSGATVYNNNLMRIRFDGAMSPDFACYQLCGPEFRRRMEKIKKATTSVAAVYAKDFFPLAIAIPPLDEQAEIVRCLDGAVAGIRQQETAVEFSLTQAAAQRKSILNAAFSGQLVPQDPNDEPASALLARIRAQREASAGTPARKRGRKARGAA